jgi:ATP diphosphatase
MAEEIDAFCFHDVVAAISAKMLRRHPHVFGNEQEIAAGKPDWEELKVAERDDQSDPSNRLYDKSALAGVGVGQGPWVVARKLQKKASKVNFDWPDAKGVLAKVHEELAEIEEAMLQLEQTPDAISEAAVEDELGDVLFSVINLSRHLKLDSGNALQKANYKFESRFRCMEQQIKAEGLQMSALSADELEQRWQQAKRQTQG